MYLGEQIYKLRTQKNLSQEELADMLEVSRQSVSKWETNSSVPELEKLIRIAEVFEVSLDELVGKAPARTQQTVCPSVELAVKKGIESQKAVGMLLLGLGLFAFILFAALSFIAQLHVDFGYALLFGIPLIVCGVICLVCKRHLGYFCALAVYMMLWFLVPVLCTYGTIAGMIHVALIIYGLCLLGLTIVRFKSLQLSTAAKTVIVVLLVFLLGIRLAAMVPPREEQAIPGTAHINIPSQPVYTTKTLP